MNKQLIEELGRLAYVFRGTRIPEERRAIANEYRDKLVSLNGLGPEDILPYEYMPRPFQEEELKGDQQVFFCPSNWVQRYRQKMKEKKIPYEERIEDYRNICFILPKKYRPHCWHFEMEND